MNKTAESARLNANPMQNFISDPHRFLGLHPLGKDSKVIRIWRPGAPYVHVKVFGKDIEAKKGFKEGLFECEVASSTTFADYCIYHQNGMLAQDPYAFLPTFGEIDAHLFNRGVHYKLYEVMGGRLCCHQGIEGAKICSLGAGSASDIACRGF